jgi:hypothetical protein
VPGKAGQARNDSLAERIEFVRELLARCQTKSSIKKAVRDKWGDLHHVTIEGYIIRAREARDADAARGRRSKRSEQLDFYRDKMANAKEDRDKIKAAERYDKLEGLERAGKLQLTGDGGGPIEITELSDEKLARIIAAGDHPRRSRQRTTAPASSSANGHAAT